MRTLQHLGVGQQKWCGPIACPILYGVLIPQTTIVTRTRFECISLDQVEELGGEGTPAAGHLKCKRHERLDGRAGEHLNVSHTLKKYRHYSATEVRTI